MANDENRCWPGYEPVKGKNEHEQGSCKPKADSKSTPGEKQFRAKRKRQLDRWEEKHPGAPRKAAQHLSKPGAKRKPSAAKKKKSK